MYCDKAATHNGNPPDKSEQKWKRMKATQSKYIMMVVLINTRLYTDVHDSHLLARLQYKKTKPDLLPWEIQYSLMFVGGGGGRVYRIYALHLQQTSLPCNSSFKSFLLLTSVLLWQLLHVAWKNFDRKFVHLDCEEIQWEQIGYLACKAKLMGCPWTYAPTWNWTYDCFLQRNLTSISIILKR